MLASATQVTGWDTAAETPATVALNSPDSSAAGVEKRARPRAKANVDQKEAKAPPPAPKKGLFRRILDMFK
jgi:hypothetical protein